MMKRTVCLCLCAFLAVLPVCGCRYRGDARAEIENELESARAENEAKIQAAEELSEPGKTPADSEETEEIAGAEGNAGAGQDAVTPEKHGPITDWDGITSSNYTLIGDRYYYTVQALKTMPAKGGGYTTTGVHVYVYTDLAQGGMQFVCPDPLCSHDNPDVCPFTAGGQSPCFCPAEDGLFYLGQFGGNAKIVKADLNKGTTQTVYTGRTAMVGILGSENSVVYLLDFDSVTDKNTRTTQTTYHLLALDIQTDEIRFDRIVPEGSWIVEIRSGRILCSTVKELIEYDMDFENPKTVFSFEGTDRIGDWYYDENRDEFWFNVLNQDDNSGHIFRILPDRTCEQVPVPADAVYCFQLTNTKIYYTPFAPTYISDNPYSYYGTVDYTNGKIYAVDRDNPEGEPKLVYDCAGKSYLRKDYVIFGDDLFYGLVKLELCTDFATGKEFYTFSTAGDYPKVHVNLATGEEEIFRFE